MTPRMKSGLLIAAFSLLGVVAAVGWTRGPRAAVTGGYNSANQPATYAPTAQSSYSQPVAYPEPAYGTPVIEQNANNCLEPVHELALPPAQVSRPVAYREYRTRPRVVRQVVERRPVVETRYVEPVKRGRSTKKSVAIVAGTSGVSAAIGALAGGGKGAGIGALAGGATGFVYDRMTHNK